MSRRVITNSYVLGRLTLGPFISITATDLGSEQSNLNVTHDEEDASANWDLTVIIHIVIMYSATGKAKQVYSRAIQSVEVISLRDLLSRPPIWILMPFKRRGAGSICLMSADQPDPRSDAQRLV
jgi:hypothetical protein